MKDKVSKILKPKVLVLLGFILVLLLSTGMVLTTTTVRAESNGKLIFNLINGGTEYDVCIDDKSQTRVVIPNTYKGKPVTKISNNSFASSQSLEEVIMFPNLKIIGNNAFLNCKKLEIVYMPNVENIGTNAFALCKRD